MPYRYRLAVLLLFVFAAALRADSSQEGHCSKLGLLADKESSRIVTKEAKLGPSETMEEWVDRHKVSLGKIVGERNEALGFSALGYLKKPGFIPGPDVTVGGKKHADGWHTQAQSDGTLLLSGLSEVKSSLTGYTMGGRFQIQGFLQRLLSGYSAESRCGFEAKPLRATD